MTENELIKTHIEECEERIGRILGYMEAAEDANTKFCERNVEVLKSVVIALEEIQQYRAIGTVEKVAKLKERYDKAKWLLDDERKRRRSYEAIGTIEEFKDLKVKNSELHNEVQAINATMSLFEQEIRNKAIDEFAEKLKDLIAKNVEDAESSNDLCCEIFQSEIDEIAERMKGGE